MMRKLFMILLALGLMLSACAGSKTLDKSKWVLQTLNGQPALADSTVTINFEDGKVTGSDGCNSFGGTYTINGDRFTIGTDMVSTLMACAEPVMAQSSAFYTALTNAATFTLDNNKLYLFDAVKVQLAVFLIQGSM
jgi:heat shock protein HslJ